MRRLVPTVDEESLDDLYAGVELPVGRDRGAVALGVVASVDGAATVNGRTAELGGEADRVAFRALRTACDAIMVGAGTVRVEGYGPPARSAARRAARTARGLTPVPRLVIVTRTLRLDPDHRVFADPAVRPLLVTHGDASPDRAAALAEVADVARFGAHEVDLAASLAHLGELGLRRVLCEGGPQLAGSLVAEDLVDEVFLSLTPLAVGGTAPRVATGVGDATRPLRLLELREHEGELLLRYARQR